MSFVRSIPRPADTDRVAFDAQALSRLKNEVSRSGGTADEQKEVAQQFEALFIQQLLKQARQASQGVDGLFQSDQVRMSQSMADEQIALQLADPGIGLAKSLLAQMQGDAGASNAVAAETGASSPEKASSISALIDMLSNSQLGRAAGAAVSAIRGAPDHIEQFVSKMTHAARTASAESGVPAELILSQAALESGWGKREIRGQDGSQSYNLFGIKASPSWKGKVVNIMTTEYENGVPQKVMQPFRAYDSYADSFADYARLISKNERYSEVVKAGTPQEAARSIQRAGYATDPKYADKLISIMGYFNSRQA